MEGKSDTLPLQEQQKAAGAKMQDTRSPGLSLMVQDVWRFGFGGEGVRCMIQGLGFWFSGLRD